MSTWDRGRRPGALVARARPGQVVPPGGWLPLPPSPPAFWSSVVSTMDDAVTVDPDTGPTMVTVSPVLTSAMASLPLSTWVDEPTTYVVAYPSALFAVMEVALTAVTVPLCSRIVG